MMNDTIATIQKRRSIRVYEERQIEDELAKMEIHENTYKSPLILLCVYTLLYQPEQMQNICLL